MVDVHLRVPKYVVWLADKAVSLGLFRTRSHALRESIVYAMLENRSAQQVTDNLAVLESQLKQDMATLITDRLAGNKEPLDSYFRQSTITRNDLPEYWSLNDPLEDNPEFKVAKHLWKAATLTK